MADRAVTVAGAALTAAGALAFARVFDSGGFVAPTLGAAIGPFVIAGLLRRVNARSVVVVAGSLTAAALYALVAVDRWRPWSGLPDLGALRVALQEGWHAARTEAPPVTATTGMLLLLVGATWLCGLLVDQLLVRDATTAALAPPLALFVVATALGNDAGGLTVTLGFAVAAVAVLLLQHQAIVTRPRGRFLGKRTGGGTGLLVAGTAIGAVAVLAGTVVAPALPGADADPLVDYRGLGSQRADRYEPAIPPTLDVGARLQRGARTEVFRVRADRPAYWRLLALDEYTGNWVLDAPEGSIDSGLDNPTSDPLVQDFEIGALGERWMPAAYEARRVLDGGVLVIRDSATLVTPVNSVNGLRYTVESALPTALAEVTPETIAGTGSPIPSELERFTALPEGFSPVIASRAAQVTAGAATPFDRARALHEFFRDPSFVYDPEMRYNAQGLEDGERVIEAFLEQRRGFCVQYAGAYAVMARSLGIPTRMVIGFTPGAREGDEFVVTNHEAHAWPEVWLAGIGWTNMFDPTPPSTLAGGSDLPGEAPAPGPPIEEPPPGQDLPIPTTVPPSGETTPDAPSVEVAAPTTEGASSPWWHRALVLPVVLAVLVGAYVAGVRIAKRRRRELRRREAPTIAVIGAWREALDRLGEAREPLRQTSTPHELADTVARTNPAAGAALEDLAGSFDAARYGRETLTRIDATRAWEQVVAFEVAFESAVPLRTRWRRRLRARARP